MLIGQSDLVPRTIDMDLYVNLLLEIFYQYEYVAQLERQWEHVLETVLCIDARISRKKVNTIAFCRKSESRA